MGAAGAGIGPPGMTGADGGIGVPGATSGAVTSFNLGMSCLGNNIVDGLNWDCFSSINCIRLAVIS